MSESEAGKSRQTLENEISAMAKRIRYYLRKNYVLNDVEVEDITQDALVAAIEAVRRPEFRLDTNTRLTTFVHGIAKHKALDHFKAKRVRRHPSLDDEKKKVQIPIDPDPEIATKDFLERVKTLIDRLPKQQAQVLDLIFHQGYSVADTAKAMNLAATQVSTLKFAALAKLRQWCLDEGFLLSVVAMMVWGILWRVIHGL